MKKSFFTLLILAVTVQLSLAQYNGVWKYPPSIEGSVLFNNGAGGVCGDSVTDATNAIMVNSPNTGYAAGNNSLGDLEKLQKFDVDSIGEITALIIYMPKVVAAQEEVVYGVISDVDPATGGPGTLRYLTQDVNSLNENMLSYIYDKVENQFDPLITLSFDASPAVDDSFFAGLILPSLAGDTIVVSSTHNGCYSGDLAWERRTDSSFHKMSDPSGKNVNIDFCIFPIFKYQATWLNRNSIMENGTALKGAFPNPAKNATNIIYAINNPANVQIEIFDALGRKVSSNNLGYKAAGAYSETINTSELSSGIYFYSLVTGSTRIFDKLTVSK